MIRRALAALLPACALAACVDTSAVTDSADDVFRLELDCPGDAATCPYVADGVTPIRVRLCLVTTRPHAASVPATVRTSSGAWQIADAPAGTTATVDLAGTHCADGDPAPLHRDLTFVPGRAPGLARVDATVGAFSHAADVVLHSAPFGELELRPAVFDLGAARAIAISATVRAEAGGPPSTGTRVTFAVVDPQPPAALAVVVPATVEVDATGAASATLQTSSEIVSLTLRATAEARPVEGEAPPPLVRELVLRDVP